MAAPELAAAEPELAVAASRERAAEAEPAPVAEMTARAASPPLVQREGSQERQTYD